MRLVYIFSGCLILGMLLSQLFHLDAYHNWFLFFTDVFLSYIMMEVGLEFELNKKEWKKYGKDYVVAALAAGAPWILCFLYFLLFDRTHSWAELLLIARFAAPTSSGILFAMLAAAGLAATWVFRKVQVLAIFDDLDTILLLIPLQFLLKGAHFSLFFTVFAMILLLYFAWRFLHVLRLPSSRPWLLIYSILLAISLHLIYDNLNVELEILLPSFVLGAMLFNPHAAKKFKQEHEYMEPKERFLQIFDRTIKILFMILVGLIMPRFAPGGYNYWLLSFHVIMVTILSNLGKCFPLFFYKDEVSIRERLAVSIGMFPRGEVGAGVLAIAIGYGISGYVATVAVLALTLNLILVGPFIKIVVKLLSGPRTAHPVYTKGKN